MSALTHEEADPHYALAANINEYYQDIADRVTVDEKMGRGGQYFGLYKFEGEDGFKGELLTQPGYSAAHGTFMMKVVSRLEIFDQELVLPKLYRLTWDKDWEGGRPTAIDQVNPDWFEGCPVGVELLHGVMAVVHERFIYKRPNIARKPNPIVKLFPE